MASSQIEIRIRYGETDQMGFCYYGNYAQFLEVARVEALREKGISYKELEEKGILLPVRNFSIKYIAPAQSELPGNNNDKRPSNLLKMEMGMLATRDCLATMFGYDYDPVGMFMIGIDTLPKTD